MEDTEKTKTLHYPVFSVSSVVNAVEFCSRTNAGYLSEALSASSALLPGQR
jgi:hypothetical protein